MKTYFMIFIMFVFFCGAAYAEPVDINNLPENFPHFTTYIYDTNSIEEGSIFLAVASEVEGVGYYLLILNSDGTLYKYKELQLNLMYS